MASQRARLLLVAGTWQAVANYACIGITAVSQLAYARLLAPSAIGAFALAFAISEIVTQFVGFPINRALINQWKDDSSARLLGSALALVGVQVTLLVVFGAVFYRWGDAMPGEAGSLGGAIAALLLAKGVEKLGFHFTVESEVRLRYGRVSAITFVATLVGSVVSIWWAACGGGVNAICARDVVSASVFALLAFAGTGWGSGGAGRGTVGRLFRYAFRVGATDAVDRVIAQMDGLAVQAAFSLETLACYSYARRLASLAGQGIILAIQKVLFSVYSKGQGASGGQQRVLLQFFFDAGAVIVLVFLTASEEIVAVVLGPDYRDTAIPLMVLSAVPMISFFSENDRTRLVAQGRFRPVVMARVLQLVVTLLGIVGVSMFARRTELIASVTVVSQFVLLCAQAYGLSGRDATFRPVILMACGGIAAGTLLAPIFLNALGSAQRFVVCVLGLSALRLLFTRVLSASVSAGSGTPARVVGRRD